MIIFEILALALGLGMLFLLLAAIVKPEVF